MNPNDPEENPEAFMIASRGRLDSTDHGDYQPIQASVNANSDKSNSSEKRLIEGNTGQRNTYNHQKSGRNKSNTSDFSNDRSNSDHSLQQPGHRCLKSDRKKGLGEGSNSFSPSVQGHSRQRSESHPSDEPRHRAASVPKFGAWDETDPASGEGFTVIFNKVKEEKQIASTKFPTIPAQANIQSDTKRAKGGSSSRSKICCCLSPSTSD
ncbi:hypothetical protein Dsin_012888 [Dipteronia sinensis]|uniref:RIN4 pathogenic type III effector avirulence factor Avr cleavage site domain-containing protein n=1 Tax=Dipteronia sinensis TaxID=43782 RepID=A0AAE0E8C9_9ROSI|nr:hypothetical protein Dsin_012888 [Dipteronia sinensis]